MRRASSFDPRALRTAGRPAWRDAISTGKPGGRTERRQAQPSGFPGGRAPPGFPGLCAVPDIARTLTKLSFEMISLFFLIRFSNGSMGGSSGCRDLPVFSARALGSFLRREAEVTTKVLSSSPISRGGPAKGNCSADGGLVRANKSPSGDPTRDLTAPRWPSVRIPSALPAQNSELNHQKYQGLR